MKTMCVLPEEMQATAGDIERLSGEAQQVQELLQRSWQRLDYGWQSYARENVDGYYRRTLQELTRAQQMLEQIATALRRTVDLLVAADQESVNLFQNDPETARRAARVLKDVFQGALGSLGVTTVFAQERSGAVLGAMTEETSLAPDLPESLELPDFVNLSWAQRFAWSDKITTQIGKIEGILERLDEVEAEADLRIGEIDTELEDLRAERAKLQEEADDWRNKLRISEDGLELGFDDKFPDAPWRTRSDDYEDQIADLDRQIAGLEEEKARYEVQRQQAIGQREVLQGNLTDLREARSDLQGRLDYLERFDGQQPADGVSAKPWSYVDAPVTNAPGERDPRVYKVALDQFAVGTNGRYLKNQQNKSETYCNIFVWDTTRAMGAEIPHWVDGQGNPVPQGQGSELSANGSIRWLESHGSERGWRTVSAQEARSMANQGHPVVATHENPGGIGHVAMVRPSDSDEIRIAQAGWNNFNDGTVQDGFRDRDVVYYAHN